MIFQRMSAILLIAIVILFSGCGGGKNDTKDDDGDDLVAISYERSEDIFKGAENAFLNSFELDEDLKKAYQAAANYLQQQPEVQSVDFPQDANSSAGFIARLKNGLGYAIAFRDSVDSSQNPKPAIPVNSIMSKLPGQVIHSRASGLIENKKALLIDSFWNFYQSCVDSGCPVISDILEVKALLEEHDYDVTLIAHSDIDDFRNINNYDLVYVGAHGIYYEEDGSPHFAILTDQPRSVEYEESGVVSLIGLIVMSGFNRGFGGIKTIPARHYAVNELFFSKNTGAFSHDSLVYIDACYSTTRENDLVAPPLVGVLSGFGLYNYLGWNESVSSISAVKASNYLFSHMLGDTPDTMAYIPEKTPPIRPYDLHAVMSGLEDKGWLVDNLSVGAVFEHMDLHQGSRAFLLRPSIDGMTTEVDIEEETQKLILTGDFGEREGAVEICDSTDQDADNCSELTLDEWSDDEITVSLSNDCDSDCTGGVRVVVDDHHSQVHPLTEWKSTFNVTGQYSPIGPTVEMNIDANFRAEIVDERASAESEPQESFSQAAGFLGLDSNVKSVFSGQFEDAIYTYNYPRTEINLSPGVSAQQGFSGAVTLKPDEGQAIIIIPVILQTLMERTSKNTGVKESEMTTVGITIYYEASMDKLGVITGDTIDLGSLTATFDDVVPENAPDENTPR